MTETFEEMCDRIDDEFKNEKIQPSHYLRMMYEYDKWKDAKNKETISSYERKRLKFAD
jgi:hypothetical protein